MASTTTNGLIFQLPYAIVRNIRQSRPGTFSVVGTDPRSNLNRGIREFPATRAEVDRDVFVYVGDVLSFDLQAPCNENGAAAYDIVAVNPSTGVETTQATVAFDKFWNRSIKVTITAINGTTGAVTYTTTYSAAA